MDSPHLSATRIAQLLLGTRLGSNVRPTSQISSFYKLLCFISQTNCNANNQKRMWCAGQFTISAAARGSLENPRLLSRVHPFFSFKEIAVGFV